MSFGHGFGVSLSFSTAPFVAEIFTEAWDAETTEIRTSVPRVDKICQRPPGPCYQSLVPHGSPTVPPDQPQASATRDLTLTAPAERDFFNKEKPPDLEMTHFHCDMVGAGKAGPFIVIIVLKDGCLVWPLHISLNKTRRSNQC